MSAKPSPFARKVRVALIEKGIPFETIVDAPWNADSTASSMNPLGKVPALDIGKGQVLYDSKVIVEYLETLDRDPVLLPKDPFARVAHKQIEALADGVCDAVVLTVIEAAREPALQSAWWIARQRGKAKAGIAEASRLLGSRECFVGDTFGLADVAVGCMLGYVSLRAPDIEWRRSYPNLAKFSTRMEARPSFRETLPESQQIDSIH
ncbi:MAG: glutathione S-transferase N-terminal domain-containing protein [Gammaproteobacteria bacterium]|nr:glutathione S-transferase N-terminal domain-containing protein [Gammaproteobacteria bacterium]MDH3412987.1 glutathione S-transferase N-terminal domain-containing protein [Gammaproteobacteria bacterium]